MKKILIMAFCLFIFSNLTMKSFAASFSPTPTKSEPTTDLTDEESLKQIEKIKDLVASRVAELKLVDKRGIIGTVIMATNSQITITDARGKKRMVNIDEITKFSDDDSKTYGISDVKKGDVLGIIGLYNKDTERLLARFVEKVTTSPTRFEGVITDIDKVNFQLISADENGNEKIIDIVPSTKNFSYTKDQGQLKSGFSKFVIGERVFASGFPDAKVKNQMNAIRVISFPQLPPSEKMKSVAPITEATPTP